MKTSCATASSGLLADEGIHMLLTFSPLVPPDEAQRHLDAFDDVYFDEFGRGMRKSPR